MVGSTAARRFIPFPTHLGIEPRRRLSTGDPLGALMIVAPVDPVHIAFVNYKPNDQSAHLNELLIPSVFVIEVAH